MVPDPDREALRRILLDRRDNTSDDMLDMASEVVRRRLSRWPLLGDARYVGVYYSIGSEIRTGAIIQDILSSGRSLLLPAIVGSDMEFRMVQDERDLVSGPFGIRQPRSRCSVAIPDVLLVPAVAVTMHGDRLGYGGGYYDVYLSRHHIQSVAAVLEKQVIRKIPPNPGDVPVDWVVTEGRLFET